MKKVFAVVVASLFLAAASPMFTSTAFAGTNCNKKSNCNVNKGGKKGNCNVNNGKVNGGKRGGCWINH